MFWVNSPYSLLQSKPFENQPGDLYWSVREKGVTKAACFWHIVNDGLYDMENEFYDPLEQNDTV